MVETLTNSSGSKPLSQERHSLGIRTGYLLSLAQDGHGCDILVPVSPADEINNHGYSHASKPERGLDLRQLMAKRLTRIAMDP